MSDITMCKSPANDGLCKDCYRKNAIPNEYRQAYFIQIPLQKDGTCEEYWQYPKQSNGTT